MEVRRFALAGVAAVLAAALVACGSNDESPLQRADGAMAGLDAGRMQLQLSAVAGTDEQTGPVGFRMEGPFSTAEGDLAVLDLSYTRLLGGEESVTRVVSTGTAVYVVADGKTTEVPADEAGALALGDGAGGVGDLGIAGWARDEEADERADGTTVVTGELDVADFLSDLARLAEQVAGGEGTGDLDPESAERLAGLARSSELVVELGKDDLPRSVRAVVDFGATVPEELRDALGPFASARLELTLGLERLTEPLVVRQPGG